MWIRSGSCTRCGDCCKGNPFDDAEQVAALGMGDQPREPPVAGYCPFYELHVGAPEGEGFCTCHEPPNQSPFYVAACKDWPTEPAQISDKPRCGYSFMWQD